MSVNQDTGRLPEAPPRYLTSVAAGQLAGCQPRTIRRNVEPDANYVSQRGDKEYGLWTAETIAAWAASREIGAEL